MMFFKRRPKVESVPDELVMAIQNADFITRPDRDATGDNLVCRCQGLGFFTVNGVRPMAERVQRHYPDLAYSACLHTARLIASEAGHRTRQTLRGRKGRRAGSAWVNAYRDQALEDLGGGNE